MRPSLSLNPDASQAALARRPLADTPAFDPQLQRAVFFLATRVDYLRVPALAYLRVRMRPPAAKAVGRGKARHGRARMASARNISPSGSFSNSS